MAKKRIKIKEFNNTQVVIPILKENGTVDREKTFAEIDKLNAPKEEIIPKMGNLKGKKGTLKDVARKMLEKAKQSKKEPIKEEVEKDA